MKPLKEQIEACRELKHNWNSYGAVAISEKTIQFALLIAARIGEVGLTLAIPSCDGTINLCDPDETVVVNIRTE